MSNTAGAAARQEFGTTKSLRVSFSAASGSETAVNPVSNGPGLVRNLLKEVEKLSPEQFSQGQKQKAFLSIWLVYAAAFLIVATIIAHVTAVPADVSRWLTRACFVAVPFCIWSLARVQINACIRKVAPGVMFLTSAQECVTRAEQCENAGAMLAAESLLEESCKKSKAKDAQLYILSCARLAVVKAHMGKAGSAEDLAKVSVSLAAHSYEARPADSNALCFAQALSAAAEVNELCSDHREARDLHRRALETIVSMKKPPLLQLVPALVAYGKACTAVGKSSEGLAYLEKAVKLASGMTNLNRFYVLTVLSNALQQAEQRAQADTILDDALAIERTLDSDDHKTLARAYTLLARALSVSGDRVTPSRFYDRAISEFGLWSPPSNPEHAFALQEYAYYLRTICDDQKAVELKNTAKKMLGNLQEIDLVHRNQEVKVEQRVKGTVAIKPTRFPIFWLLFVLWQSVNLWSEGLRAAPAHRWSLLVVALLVLGIKLRHKYAPPSSEDLNEGTRLAMVAVIPFARSVLPEICAMTKKQMVITGLFAAALFGAANFVQVKQGEVPEGLLQKEYLMLGVQLSDDESFEKSKIALDKAIAAEPASEDGKLAAVFEAVLLPTKVVPAAAKLNQQALVLSVDGKLDDAGREWRRCVALYPDFEAPQVHLAALAIQRKGYGEADSILKNVLKKNPNYVKAWLILTQVQSAQKDYDGSKKSLERVLALMGGEANGASAKLLY